MFTVGQVHDTECPEWVELRVESRDQRKAHYYHHHTSGQNNVNKYFLEIKKILQSIGRNTNEGHHVEVVAWKREEYRPLY